MEMLIETENVITHHREHSGWEPREDRCRNTSCCGALSIVLRSSGLGLGSLSGTRSTIVFYISEVLVVNDWLTVSFIHGTPHPGLPVHSQALWPEKASVL